MNTYTHTHMYSFLWTIILHIVISIIIIYSAHQTWNYLKDTYSTRRTKDLVNTQIKKYKDMMEKIQNTKVETPSPFQNETEKQSMNKELLEYMNNELGRPVTIESVIQQ